MLTEEIEHKIGRVANNSTPSAKERIRQDLKREVDEYLASGGTIDRVPAEVAPTKDQWGEL